MEILSPPGQPGDDQHNNHFISSSCDGPDRQRTTRPPPPAISSDLDGGISPHDPRNSRLFQKNLSPISDHWVSNHTNSPGIPQRSSSLPRLPSYIRPVPPYLRQRDLQYLADSGALTIPDDAFRDELLRTYVHVVYPFMPAIDLGDFLGPIMNLDDRSPVSLLLFQAVMFAGVTFVDAKFLQARGYDSRKAARKAFFSRVRLLYGLDYEQDRLPLLQAVLLMTYWYDCPENDKDTWYWMGIALGLAQPIHRL
ncbi:hypothetical protein SBRCBS47491_009199 [Sporothrix bragantina]|uniref:Xylanolytic transcriptional activator regulatory domain-containing protein n=1 Tax=Sporothrix bragantina TaxID=671064 RepID=A0ABP0CSQ3_9PEZI